MQLYQIACHKFDSCNLSAFEKCHGAVVIPVVAVDVTHTILLMLWLPFLELFDFAVVVLAIAFIDVYKLLL